MKTNILLSILGFLLTQSLLAEGGLPSLPKFLEAPDNPVKVEATAAPAAAELKCDEIVAKLEAYSKEINRHHQAFLGYLDHVAEIATEWQELLSPLEKQTTEIPENYFISLQTASAGIEKITYYAYDNTAYFGGELSKIITALKNCKLQ